MMSRIRSGEFTHLVVWKIDRISRNLMDFTAMYAELKDLHVTFISKNEQFDTSSAIGEAMLKIILVFAELERKMTAERVSAVALSRASDGKWNGGRCPYGYTHEKGTSVFTVNPEEAKIVACDLPDIQRIRNGALDHQGTEQAGTEDALRSVELQLGMDNPDKPVLLWGNALQLPKRKQGHV